MYCIVLYCIVLWKIKVHICIIEVLSKWYNLLPNQFASCSLVYSWHSGEVKEKETAHKEYKKAISEGHGAYLMDQDEETPVSLPSFMYIVFAYEKECKYPNWCGYGAKLVIFLWNSLLSSKEGIYSWFVKEYMCIIYHLCLHIH